MCSSKQSPALRRRLRTLSDRGNLCCTIASLICLISISSLLLGSDLVNASTGATIVGQVIFQGAIPAPQQVEVTANPDFCGSSLSIQNLLVDSSSKGIQGTVVSVEGMDKAPGKAVAAPTSELRNHKCSFLPRIGTGNNKTYLHVTNQDPIMHNTHIHHGKRTFVNVAQVPGGRTFKKRIKRPGILTVKCDKHEFMEAYILVFDHPYHSVTNSTGHFRISGVPPGPQKLALWHEALGILHTTVEVPADGEVSVTIEYPNK